MARHTVTFEEMSDYLTKESWAVVAASCHSAGRKRLEASTTGMFRVTVGDDETYLGASLGLAVDAYNDAL